MVVDNQERGPANFRQFEQEYRAVPGVGFYKPYKTSKALIILMAVDILLLAQQSSSTSGRLR